MVKRLSIYAIPTGPLGALGKAWLGMDINNGNQCVAVGPKALITRPRRYGFHATIKAPFHTTEIYRSDNMQQSLDDITARHPPIPLALSLQQIGGFFALTLTNPSPALEALARDVVTGLDRFRAPISAGDLARRRPDKLTNRQRALLAAWGYPFVFEQFNFHITLTGPVPPENAARSRKLLAEYFAPALAESWTLDSLAICGETTQGNFRLIYSSPLAPLTGETYPEGS